MGKRKKHTYFWNTKTGLILQGLFILLFIAQMDFWKYL